jgi:uncharacterized membrane protein
MLRKLSDLNRFLSSQFLYPLLLSTLLAAGFFAFRVAYSGRWYYDNLPWNLFLAWVPYFCSLWAAAWYRRHPDRWWMLLVPGTVWLVFFPNAPYIVTDFYHLEKRPPIPLWYDIGLIATFAWTGCFLAIASLRTMQFLVGKVANRITSWVFVAIALGLSGVGVYLGRFERWNSWDLFLHPGKVLEDLTAPLLNPMENLRFLGFSLMFTAILLVIYLMFISFTQAKEIDS